ncbi:hypothetical protein HPB47_024476 [Ixodes persulcatus]|uniref:Uncharacterized protein n=1 Tax=Ixodes persulcatus TaxID=34615 RepID=A0AC60Q6H5_IXOPE|nr:hypothetical protein HPB47_024476 [Ixodes persulcatus]
MVGLSSLLMGRVCSRCSNVHSAKERTRPEAAYPAARHAHVTRETLLLTVTTGVKNLGIDGEEAGPGVTLQVDSFEMPMMLRVGAPSPAHLNAFAPLATQR